MSLLTPSLLRGLLVVEALLVAAVLVYLGSTYVRGGSAQVVVEVPAHPPSVRAMAVTDPEDADGDQGADQLCPADSADPRIQEALVALGESRIDDAIRLLRVLTSERPLDAEVQADLGIALLRGDDVEGAKAAFTAAAELDHAAIAPRFALGTLYLQKGRPAEALPWFDTVVALNAYDVGAHLNRGVALARLGEHERAAADYEEVTRLDRSPGAVRAWFNLALVRLRQGRSSEALTALASGLRLKPDHEPSRLKRAVVLARIGLKEEAVAEYRKLLDLAPDHAVGLTNLGALFLSLGRPAEAEGYLRKANAAELPPTRAAYNLGVCLLQLDRPAEAVPVFAAAVAQDPAHAPASYNLGVACLRSGDDAQAAAAFATACALAPDQAEYQVNWGLALAGTGDEAAAAARYAKAVAQKPDYFKAWFLLGKSRRRLADLDGALAAWTQAVTVQTDSRAAWHLIGEVQLRRAAFDDAEVAVRRALTLEETLEDFLLLAEIQSAAGRKEDAEATLRQALAVAPRDPDVNKQLADVLADRSAWGEALRHASLVADQKPESPLVFNLGLRAYHDERYDEALALFTAAAAVPRRASAAGNMRGRCLLALDRPAEAVVALTAAQAADPANTKVYFSLARAQALVGDFGGAIATLEAATAREPDSATAWRLLCESLVAGGRPTEAVAAGERAIALAPQETASVLAHAQALVAAGQRDEAIRRVQVQYSIHPENPELQAFLASHSP